MKKSRLLSAVCALLLAIASAPGFAAFVYDVNRVIGAGSVTGTITTDETLGILTTANILDWDLTLSDGIGTFTLFGPGGASNSGLEVATSGFSADSNELIYDFSASGYVLFQHPQPGSGQNFWCISDGVCDGSNEQVAVQFANRQSTQLSGLVVIASISAVPVPAAVWLFGSGLLGLIGMARRKKTA